MYLVAALLERVAAGHVRADDPTARFFSPVPFQAARKLPLQQRLCLALRHVIGLTVPETATAMGVSEAGVEAIEYTASQGLQAASTGSSHVSRSVSLRPDDDMPATGSGPRPGRSSMGR